MVLLTDILADPHAIDTGTMAGQILTWVATTFGTAIGAALTALLVRMLKKSGIEANALLRDQLQQIVVNGLNAGAAAAARELAGRGKIDIKSAAVQKAIEYAQAHGADTMKALGIDPTSKEAVEAIKARIETAITDPATPTNPILEPTAAAPRTPERP
jgi:hypothetical protein